jgi:hypothetical protein
LVFSLLSAEAFAGTITGQIQTASGGAVANGTLLVSAQQRAALSPHL